jgi:hypothetical protein
VAASVAVAGGATAAGGLDSSPRIADAQGEQRFQRATKLLFSFAAAFPPRAEGLFPSDGWMEAISAAGYSHLSLQPDPFFHAEMDMREWRENLYQLLSLFDVAAGPSNRAYRAWLSAISERASHHGLKLTAELWEPRVSPYAWQALPADWRGPHAELCVSHPQARAWLLEAFRSVLEAAPAMDCLILGTLDNGAKLCGETCPRCASKSLALRMGELYRDIEAACLQVRSSFRLIPYNWWWPDAYYHEVYSRLQKGTPILTRMERGAVYTPDPEHPEWSGHIFDESVACDELGPDFEKAKKTVEEYGGGPVFTMPTLSGMFEAFELPYVPALGQVARKFDRMRSQGVSGWVDYDCGGIHRGLILDLVGVAQHNPQAPLPDWIRLVAERRYGSQEAARLAMKGWEAWDNAVRALPTSLDLTSIPEFSGRFGVAMALTPMHPFLLERARQGRDAGHERFWFDPHNFLTPEALPPVRHCLRRALTFGKLGLAACQQAAERTPASYRANAELDAQITELVLLAWQSSANFYEWAAAAQGDKIVPLAEVIRSEIQVTRRYKELQMRPELEVGNMLWLWQRELSWSVPEAATDSFHCSRLPGCTPAQRFPESIGDWYAWKIKLLEEQLESHSST